MKQLGPRLTRRHERAATRPRYIALPAPWPQHPSKRHLTCDLASPKPPDRIFAPYSGSHSPLGPFGRSRAEGAAGRRGPVLTGAICCCSAGTAAAPAQCGPTVPDLRHSHDGLDFCALQARRLEVARKTPILCVVPQKICRAVIDSPTPGLLLSRVAPRSLAFDHVETYTEPPWR
jgi:hypothetical protein